MATTKRKFNVSYGNALEYSKDMRNLFLDDSDDFVAFDADFDEDFTDEWLAEMQAAEVILTDETVVDAQTGLTLAVESAMKKCRNCFQDLKYYALKAFDNDEERWKLNELGLDNYDDDRNSQTQLLQFMRNVFNIATKYSAELIDVNYSAPQIAEINTLANALDTANQAQNKFIAERPGLTSKRIKAYNKFWDRVTLVARAAKRIYKDDPEQFNKYLLPATHEPDEVLSLRGKVINIADGEPIYQAEITLVGTDITVKTDSNGKYGIAGLTPGSYELHCSASGFTSVTLTNIPILEDVLAVQNFTLQAISP